jgi:hypothetical protein
MGGTCEQCKTDMTGLISRPDSEVQSGVTLTKEVKMNARISIYSLCSVLALFFVTAGQAMSTNYPAPIQYKQTMVKVLQETDVQGWPSGGYETSARYPDFIAVSADGSKVGVTVKLNNYSDRHIFVMNSDGTGLTDLTSKLPAGVSVGTLQLNDNGSRLFFWDYGNGNIHYFDTSSPYDIHPAYKPDGFWVGSKRSYGLNSDGTVIYLKHFWNVDDISHYGLVSTVVGSNVLTPVVDVLSLTPAKTADYDLEFIDAARTGERLLLTYYPDYWRDSREVMWESSPLQPMPNEWHDMIWDNSATSLQYCHIISADGSKALYNFMNTSSRPELHLLNLDTGDKTPLTQLIDGLDNLQFPALSPDGTIARWSSGGYYATRRVIATGDLRDTFSARFPEAAAVGASNLTDITSNNRYYYMGSEPASVSYIHRIDMAPATTAPAPDIVSISFGQPQLVLGDTTSIPITVQVSDPKGTDNILSVQMHTLVDGREFPYGQVYEPLSYSNPLTSSGGGIFNGTVSPYAYSSFYTTNQLPRQVGVRVVVRNKDEHYVLADTAITVTKAGLKISGIGSNSIGSRNTIKISDMSGIIPASGGAITVSAWDVNGNALVESGGAVPLKLYNHGTTIIPGLDLASRFLNGTAMLYKFSIDSSEVLITNVKNSTDDTFKVPIVYLNGMTNFVSNAIGNYNTIKVSDISGTLPASGGAITVSAWDVNGNAIPESGSAAPLKLYNHGTTILSGSVLAARFPTGYPITYAFYVQSAKVVVTNVKSSTDGKLNVPVAHISGVSNFVSNSIGSYNTLEISDLSGALPFGGGAISVKAWDAAGNALAESGSTTPLILYNHGTTTINGSDLAKRFTGSSITYDFSIGSSKVLISNVKSSTDGFVEIPSIFTSGISNFVTNYVRSLNTIKISDTSGTLTDSGVVISITAWDSNGNELPASGSAAPLYLYNQGTTSISGSELAARFISGFPVLYEFSIGSTNAIVTSLTTSVDGTIKAPTVFTIGPYGGI